MEDNDKHDDNIRDDTDDKRILAQRLDRDLGFLLGHQSYQPPDYDDDKEEGDEVKDNNKDYSKNKDNNDDKNISALGLYKDCGFWEEINVKFVSNCFLHCLH